MNFLFVCTGNSCRSPIAEYYFKQLCKQNNLPEVTTASAGTKAEEGREAPELSVQLFKLLGLDISSHRSTPLSAELVENADAIIAMGHDHVDHILNNYPAAADKTRTLMSLLDSEIDVNDPHNGDLNDFEATFLSMMPALAELGDRVIRSKQENLRLNQIANDLESQEEIDEDLEEL